MKHMYLFIVCIVLFSFTFLSSQVPRIMNYQGKITDDDGVALHGTYSIDFGIYNVPTGGSALWSETRTVNIENGLFDIQLGTITPIFLDFLEPYWLELKISTDGGSTWETFDPREKLATVSYAFRAIYSDTANVAYYADTAFYSLYALFTPPSALILPDPAEVCIGEDLVLNGNPSGGSGTFTNHSWTGDTGPLSATDIPNPTFNASSAGTYDLTYTVTDDRGGTASDNITVTVHPDPVTPSPTADPSSICSGESSTLYANTTADEYNWLEGSCTGDVISTAQNTGVNPTSTTTYFLKVANEGCWSECGEITVTVNTLSTEPISASATPNPVCSGESTALNVIGGSLGTGASWEWYSGSCGGTYVGSDSPSVSPTTTTTYYVRAEGICNTTSCASVTVTVNTVPSITAQPSNQTIDEGDSASFSVIASGATSYQWQENDGGGWGDISDGGSNPAYSGATTATLTLTNVPLSYNGYDYRCVMTNDCGSVNSNSANLTVNVWMVCGENTVIDVTNPSTGDTWMDRNLGASQQATAYNDYNAYGALFQWGRLRDGHECITWTGPTSGTPDNGTTTTLSSSDNPGHNLFITTTSSPNDWRSPQNDALWQGVSGINNPCPDGYRLPTESELENERLSWSSNDYNGAYSSPLKFAVTGYRSNSGGALSVTGNRGYYWSSTINGISIYTLRFTSDNANFTSYPRACGCCTRCIKDCHVPSISSHPSDQTIDEGDNVSFSVTVSGATSYQWQEDNGGGWSDISDGGSDPLYSGATTSILTLTNVPLSYDGYDYRCRVSNDCGSINSNSADLTVNTPPFLCGTETVLDIDGNIYNTVSISEQCWLKENLKVTRDADGNSITRYCYDDNPGNCDEYGGLYDWSTIMNGEASSSSNPSGVQGICPDGWHVPSDEEWCQLENAVEPGTDPSCNTIGWARGTNTGGNMKETGTTHWATPNTGATNSSGFTTLPSGDRDYAGVYRHLSTSGSFWSATEFNASQAWERSLYYTNSAIYRNYIDNRYAWSVRCLKDICPSPSIDSHPVNQTIEEGDNVSFTVSAMGDILGYQWQENDGSGWSNIPDGGSEPVYSGATTATLTLANVPLDYNGYEYRCKVTSCGSVNSNTASLTVNPWAGICGEMIVNDVTNPSTGDTWMDRNLGASRQATAYNDYQAYGALFQWGRLSDGHECITWTGSESGTPVNGTTTATSFTDNPGHSLFIANESFPVDWRVPQNDALWQDVGGINNPCPCGYRLPTETELSNERSSWSSTNSAGAFASPLKLVVAGSRVVYGYGLDPGDLEDVGTMGNIWSSTLNGTNACFMRWYPSGSNVGAHNRAWGYTVRCIKDNCLAPTLGSHPSNQTIDEGDNASFSVSATGSGITYQWQENDGGGWSNISDGGSNPAYSGAITAILSLTNVPVSYDGYDYRCIVSICGIINSNSANLSVSIACGTPAGETIVIDVTNPSTGETWMDRNLGASRQATAYNDYQAYGALFQWGRLSDGHECITWTSSSSGSPDNGTTSTNSATDDPSHSLFIMEGGYPWDWREPQNDNLWQGVSGINNPCPSGYRLPTSAEFNNERLSWSSNDYIGAYNSPLKLVQAGDRGYDSGVLGGTGTHGYYWSSTLDSYLALSILFTSSSEIIGSGRAYGQCVRCIKD